MALKSQSPNYKAHISANVLISWRGISIRVFDRLLFTDTDWCIRPGEQWAVIGGNGSGKSVLARALRAELPLIGGDYEFNFPGQADPEGAVAVVSFRDQGGAGGTDFYQARWNSSDGGQEQTVRDCLSPAAVLEINPFEVGASSGATPVFRKRHKRLIDLLDIRNLLPRRMRHLSNGETRKVLIARALLKAPAVAVLDDPFTGLDPAFRRRLKSIIGRLIDEGLSIILMTSRPEELPAGITHVAIIEDGAFIAAGPRRKVMKNTAIRKLYSSQAGCTSARPEPKKGGRELIRLNNVSVVYESRPVLSNINWEIKAGEHWAVFGPNGAGKTTLLSLVTGDNPQAYGNDIRLFGRPRGSGESIWDIKKRIGHVAPEVHLAFDGSLTGLETVCSGWFDSIGLFEECSSALLRRARKIMRELDLLLYADREMDELSDGQQRMLLLARAMIKNPLLLILDEPCQGLDRLHRELFHRALQQAAARTRAAIIYVTHRHQEVPVWIERRLHLNKGCIIRR